MTKQKEGSGKREDGSKSLFSQHPSPLLAAGMCFCVYTKSAIACGINAVQTIRAVDNTAKYNHAGIITDESGETFEALWKIRYGSLDAYRGCPVIIARHVWMDERKYLDAWPEIVKLNGSLYPFPRLLLHAIGLAKYVHWRYPVCSELVAKFEFECGLRKNWWGMMPDNLADEWTISRYYDVIFEGVWEGLI